MSNSFDPDQDRHSVGPDLGPNCLQMLSADDKSRASKETVLYGCGISCSYSIVEALERVLGIQGYWPKT